MGNIDDLVERSVGHESSGVTKVEMMHYIIQRIAGIGRDPPTEDGGVCDKKSSTSPVDMTSKVDVTSKSSRLILFQDLVRHYFEGTIDSSVTVPNGATVSAEDDADKDFTRFHFDVVKDVTKCNQRILVELAADVAALLREPSLNKPRSDGDIYVRLDPLGAADYTARSLAKLLHGIDSTRASRRWWLNHPLWGKWRSYSFHSILEAISLVFLK